MLRDDINQIQTNKNLDAIIHTTKFSKTWIFVDSGYVNHSIHGHCKFARRRLLLYTYQRNAGMGRRVISLLLAGGNDI